MPIIEKIKKLFSENRPLALLITAALILFLVFIFSLIFGKKDQGDNTNDNYLIETPLPTGVDHDVTIDSVLYKKKEFPDELKVYKIVSSNESSNVEAFLLKLGLSGFTKSSVQSLLYTWTKGNSLVEYVPNDQSVTFVFEEGVVTGLNTQFDTSESAQAFMSRFYNQFLQKDYKFTNGKITKEGNRIRVEASRMIDNYPLYLANHNSYTDYLVVDINGNLYKGVSVLIDYDREKADTIKLVDVSNLQSLLGTDTYPKEVFQGVSEALIKAIGESGQKLDAADSLSDIPIAKLSTAKSLSLVYYYSNTSFKQIVPAYRLEAEGKILYNSKEITVPLTIFTNALDPSRVYIPNE